MINDALGVRTQTSAGEAIAIAPGRHGHAIYGPYAEAAPGAYVAEFFIEAPREAEGERMCAVVEVVSDAGQRGYGSAQVFSSQIAASPKVELPFSLDRAVKNLEMRVHVNGSVALTVVDACRFRPAKGVAVRPPAAPACKFLAQHAADVQNLYNCGFGVRVVGGDLLVEHSGVSVNARIFDDIRFLGEIFLNRVYALTPPGPSVLIDIGMNLGVTSLLLAQEPKFEEIHSFEPFTSTYTRAVANLARNPQAAKRITPYNFGLSDREETLTGFFNPEDSGMSSTQSAGSAGQSASASIKDAGAVLGPIFESAEAAGRRIVMKIDCEGSEFPVFRSLESAGLLGKVSAMMVEWHRGFGDRDRELFAPLLRHGFVLIDRDPPEGNGFFYAVRAA